MQNTSPHKSKATELELLLDRWERRHEWRLLSKTIPRSLLIALLISLIVGAIGYFRFRLTAEQLALITAALCASVASSTSCTPCSSRAAFKPAPVISTSNSAWGNESRPPLN